MDRQFSLLGMGIDSDRKLRKEFVDPRGDGRAVLRHAAFVPIPVSELPRMAGCVVVKVIYERSLRALLLSQVPMLTT